MTVTTLTTRDLTPRIATEICADKRDLLSGVHACALRELLEQRGVLVFPQIHFTDEEQVAFTETLGTPATGRRAKQVCNRTPDTLDTGADKQTHYMKGSLYWHIDGTMNAVPIFASLLSSKVLPRNGGGDTEFCNTYAAYEDLSDEDKQPLESLRAMHSTWNRLLHYDPEPDIGTLQQMMAIGQRKLPLVWTHRSGRKSLILGCTASHIVGMDVKTSNEVLVRLLDWATRPEFVYRHKWSVGDLVMWDNTGTMHRARPYDPDSGRRLTRTKLAGEEPFT
jgi:alpha-ketoglutarate-dependent taurine dioxygenase